MITLPSITASNLERQRKLTFDARGDDTAYDERPYAWRSSPARQNAVLLNEMSAHVTELTGLDQQFVKYSGGRLSTQAYLREVHRERGEIGSVYDSNVTNPDPFPYSPDQENLDPNPESGMAIITRPWHQLRHRHRRLEGRRPLQPALLRRRTPLGPPGPRSPAAGAVARPPAKPPRRRSWAYTSPSSGTAGTDLSCPFMGSVSTPKPAPRHHRAPTHGARNPRRPHVLQTPAPPTAPNSTPSAKSYRGLPLTRRDLETRISKRTPP